MSTPPVVSLRASAAPADWSSPEEYLTWSQVTGLLRRHWFSVAAMVALCVAIGFLYVSRAARRYEATAVLQIEKDQYNLPEMVTRRATDEAELSTEIEVIKSGALSAAVVRELALNVMPLGTKVPRSELLSVVTVTDATPAGTIVLERQGDGRFVATSSVAGERVDVAPGTPATVGGVGFTLRGATAVGDRLELGVATVAAAAGALRRDIRVERGDRNANVIRVRYTSTDPSLASAVPDLLTRHYIVQRMETTKNKVRTAVAYLEQEADTLKRQLLDADQALHDFRQREGVVSLADEATSAVAQSAQLRTSRAVLDAERQALERLVGQSDTAAAQYRNLTAFPTLIGNPIVANLLRSIGTLEGERTQLLERRTPRDPDVLAINRQLSDADAQLKALTLTYLSGLRQQVSALSQALGTQNRAASTLPGKSMAEDQLSRRPKVLSDVYSLVETRLQEARIAESATNPGVAIIDRPEVPTRPVWPRRGLILAVSLLAGLVAGVALAWVRDGMDGSIHSRADVTRALEVPILSVIPHIRPGLALPGRAQSLLMSSRSDEPRSFQNRLPRARETSPADAQSIGAVLEAYTWLETSLNFSRPDGELRIIAFTSPVAREGKTVSASNFASSVARHGRRVLLIDADMRRGLIHQVFNLQAGPGLAEVLAGDATVEQVVRVVPVGGEVVVHVMPRGEKAQHPTALLKPSTMRRLLRELDGSYDLIIIDSPPVNLVSDPLLIAKVVDGVVLVARAGVTDTAALTQAARHLQGVDAPLLGVVLNDIHARRDSSYDESYRYLDQAGAYASAASV